MIEMDSKMKKLAAAVTMGLFMTAIYFAGRQTAALVAGRNVQTDKAQSAEAGDICVVVDAGHGGMDPGKIGVNDVPEKDINLKIALLVKGYLESNDIRVVMTRETDAGLHDGDASNKKVQDMRHLSLIHI